MYKFKLKEVLSELSEDARKIRDPELKRRLYLVKEVVNSKKNVSKACANIGASRSLFYKCAGLLLKHKRIEALKPQSRRPKQSPRLTKPSVSKKVCRFKKIYPFYGPKRISFYLKKCFKRFCHPSTIYKILKRAGLISKENRKKRGKKHMKRYRRPIPGYLQMDIKYVPYLIGGEQNYQISVIDHCSSWRLIRGYEGKDLYALRKFLKELELECSFKIIQIQTDNDAVFTDRFTSKNWFLAPTGEHYLDVWCRERDIEHKLIPVGEKELNGKVENSHKFDDEEFYSQRGFENFWNFEKGLRFFTREWNEQRHTETLGWHTPVEVVWNAHVLALASILNFLKQICSVNTSRLRLNAAGLYVPERGRPKELKNTKYQSVKIKSKKLKGVNRYLAWMDWDENNKLILVVSLSSMSGIYSVFINYSLY